MTVTASVLNDGLDDLFVSLWDVNAGPNPVLVLDGKRINAGDQLGIDLEADGSGQGSVTWTAKGTTPDNVNKSKSGQQSDINANDLIKVDIFGV
jgi:hypothetical protein